MAITPQVENEPKDNLPKALGNRPFGLIFAGIFVLIGAWPLLFNGDFRQWAGIIAGFFTVAALIVPVALGPLNRAWSKFGQIMHKITNPILMGLVFFITVVPTGLILKLLGKDPLKRKLNGNVDSYWIERNTHAITKESFDNQF